MANTKEPYILVFGASVVDIFGFCDCKYKKFDSNPGYVKMSFGGVSRNIAENMARIGLNTKFISVLGNDETGRSMVEHSKQIGYDMQDSLILQNSGTPTYMAILNEKGEMISAVADMKSITEIDFEFIDSKRRIIEESEYTCLDADDPVNLEYILNKFKGTKFILDPISAAKAKKIKHLVKHFHTIKPNRHEAEALVGFPINNEEDLKKAGEYFLSEGVKSVFISLDEDGIYYTDGNESGRVKAKNVEVKNVTGAGDAFVAGIGYGYMNDINIVDTVKFAIAMSSITISHEETINPNLDLNLVKIEMEKLIWEEKKH